MSIINHTIPQAVFDTLNQADEVALANINSTNSAQDIAIAAKADAATTYSKTEVESALNLKAPLANPSFTGTVSGITKSMVGLSNVDNTSDVNKPVSTAHQAALDLKANLASPAFTGTPIAPTATSGTNTSQVATTAFVKSSIDSLINGAPAALDTLREIADQLANDESAASALTYTVATKAPIASPTFTGIVSGITKSMVGLANVDNTSDVNKPVSTAQQTSLDLKANITSPTFTGTVSGITKTMVGLSNVDNTDDTAKPVSTAQQTALDLKANLVSPTFTGTVSGITSSMIGLANVDNTSDVNKPVSTAQQTALDLKANLASPTFTGTVSGITKAMIGLSNVDNTSDVNKPVSTAQQAALDLKANQATTYTKTEVDSAISASSTGVLIYKGLYDMTNALPTATTANKGWYYIASNVTVQNGYYQGDWAVSNGTSWDRVVNSNAVTSVAGRVGTITLTSTDVGLGNVNNTSDSAKPVSTAQQTALDLKAPLASPTFTGTVSGITKSMIGLGSVENTALSTWAGTTNISTTGTITSGTWSGSFGAVSGANLTSLNGTNISSGTVADARIATTLTGKTYNGITPTAATTGFTLAGGTTSKTLTVNNTLGFSGTDGSTLNIGSGGTLGTGAYATIANYAQLVSPTFTGTPLAPTATAGTNTTQIATTAFVVAGNALKENIITAGTTSQYYRGDKSWQTLDKTTVGLANVENTALSTWAGTANITTLGTVTTGTFGGTLGAISGASLTNLNASNLASGTIPIARLGTGTPATTNWLRGDNAWIAPTKADVGLGNVDNTSDINKPISTTQETRYQSIEAVDVTQNNRLTALENSYWADLIGNITMKTSGGTAPTFSAFRGGNCQAWFFAVGNAEDIEYHFPHDYTLNSDIFLHLHWGHNGTAISGNLVVQISMTWAKGFNQGIFPAELVFNMTIPATNLTVAPRWGHIISEVQISAATPTATQFNTSVFEPDGKLKINAKVITNPTITGGASSSPYWLGMDVHYLSTGHGTKNKAPNFYV